MSYTIPYTDFANKVAIIIEDGVINEDTSLKLPGRNVTAYGTAIAENFLHLLENFADDTEPPRPVEGQIWYDTNPGAETLKVFNGANWVPTGGLVKANSAPQAAQSTLGDLWVDTDNQQLYLYSGSGWILVGPEFSDGLITGAKPLSLLGTDDLTYNVLQIEIASKPAIIITTNSFVPKVKIPGFSQLVPGINLSANNITGAGVLKYNGVAEKAENLIVNNTLVSAGNFLRGDTTSTTFYGLNVQNNSGINYGVNSEMNIGIEGNAGIIQHNIAGSSIDFKVKNDGILKTVFRIDSDLKLGINTTAPAEALDVSGNVNIAPRLGFPSEGNLKVNSSTNSLGIDTGSIVTLGGVGIAQDLNVGGNITLLGDLFQQNVYPDITNVRTIGSSTLSYATIYATNFIGSLVGNVSGTVSGLAGSAEKLASATTFRVVGDIEADDLVFDGQEGGSLKIFDTVISNEIISNKTEVLDPDNQDEIIINRVTSDTGLKKIQVQNLLKIVPTMPVGMIVPFAGIEAPDNWQFCFGQELLIINFANLFEVIGYTYKAEGLVTEGYFALPDLRGRSPLGKDDMGTSGSANVVPTATILGAKDGTNEIGLQLRNLPQHKHSLTGDSGDQYYVIRDTSGSPNDEEAIVYDAPTGLGAGQALPNSGDILTTGDVGQTFDIMNPYMTLNFIIYAGLG